MPQVRIIPVTSSKDWDRFINLPWYIYKNEPNWVPPLKNAVRKLLDTQKHPFWRFSKQAIFLAMRGDQAVGRIVGIIDGNSNSYHSERACAWGFFECEDNPETARLIIGAVEEWGRSHEMDFLRGPLNPSTNYEVGMLFEGFEHPPSLMMPYNPPYYLQLVEAAGFVKEKDLYALTVDQSYKITERLERLCKRVTRKTNVTVRHAIKSKFAQELAIVQEIYNSAWSDNWGFVPMTEPELEETAKEMKAIMDEDIILFIYQGAEPVGVLIMLPDISPLLKRFNGKIGLSGLLKVVLYKKEISGVRCLAMGIKKSYQGLGLPLVAFNHLFKVWESKRQYKTCEVGWNLEDNHDVINLEQQVGCRIYKKYRIFRKDF